MSLVHQRFTELMKEGMDVKNAAKIAQKETGMALRTGLPFRKHHRSLKDLGKIKRQYE